MEVTVQTTTGKVRLWAFGGIGAGVVLILGVAAASGGGSAAPSATATVKASGFVPSPTVFDHSGYALAYLRSNYPGTSWLGDIKAVETVAGALWVSTDLYPDGDATGLAAGICSAVSAFELDQGEFTGVRVTASDGTRLVQRLTVGDRC